jgi:hypothetical protein
MVQYCYRLDKLKQWVEDEVEADHILGEANLSWKQVIEPEKIKLFLELFEKPLPGIITGLVALFKENTLVALWVTDGNRPEWLGCYYFSLTFYLSSKGTNLVPYCLREDNEYYQRSQ